MRTSAITAALLLTGCPPSVTIAPQPSEPVLGNGTLEFGPQVTCADPADDPDLPGFVDITEQSGIAHVPLMPEWNGGQNGITSVQMEAAGGFIVADLDGNGLLDLVFTGFRSAPRFYFGEGDLQFGELSAELLGVELSGFHINGGSAADFDGDGDMDLWFGTYEGTYLYRNDGFGRFEEVSDELGIRGRGNHLSGSWADPDRDGDLDLYVAAHSPGSAGPGLGFENDLDSFWRQRNDGTFVDATLDLYPDGVAGQGFIGGWFDADNDGWLDLYVVNDGGTGGNNPPNRYFANNGGSLEPMRDAGADVGMLAMGLALGDMDNDGDFDAHVTNAGSTLLLRNEGGHLWTDISLEVESFSDGSAGDISGGTIFFDHDNDGVLELHTSFGHMPTKIGPNGTENRLEMPDQLWRPLESGWLDVAAAVGAADAAWSRTALAADLDGDGFPELITWSMNEGPRIQHARCNDRAWLQVELVDPTSANRFAIGARITATGNGTPLVIREIGAGSTGTMSGGPPVALMGLNEADTVDLDVRWPDGETERYLDVPTRRRVTINR
jgi:hypothetical protein